jgi:hypothetical protein
VSALEPRDLLSDPGEAVSPAKFLEAPRLFLEVKLHEVACLLQVRVQVGMRVALETLVGVRGRVLGGCVRQVDVASIQELVGDRGLGLRWGFPLCLWLR